MTAFSVPGATSAVCWAGLTAFATELYATYEKFFDGSFVHVPPEFELNIACPAEATLSYLHETESDRFRAEPERLRTATTEVGTFAWMLKL